MRHHNLSRRVLTALVVVGIVGGVSACAAQGEPDKSEPIEIWSRSAPDGAATYDEVFKAFTKNTGIEVNYQPVMEFDTQLQSRAASKDLPDMWINDAGLMGTYNAQGWLSPVTATDFAGHDQISDDTWNQNVAPDGAMYGVPWSRQAFATVIRKDWRENLGYDVPKNWDELADLAHAFATEDPDGNGKDDTSGMVVPGTAQNGYIGWWASSYIWQAGGDLIEPTGDGKYKSVINSPETAKAATWIKDRFCRAGDVVPGSLNYTTTEAKFFAEGTAGMYLTGPYMWPGYDQAVGKENVEVIPMPAGPAGTTVLAEGENIYFGAGSDKSDAQKKLAEFLISPEAQKIAMTPVKTSTGGISQPVVRLPVNTEVDVVKVTGDDRWKVIQDSYVNDSKTYVWGINFQPFRQALGEGLNAIMSDCSSDVTAGLSKIDQEFTAELKEQGLVE